MGHRTSTQGSLAALGGERAVAVADALRALAHPGRLRILAMLEDGPATVGEMGEALGMEQSALSHQLRLLRDHGFVLADRDGRHVRYRLYDDHVGELIDQAIGHAEHVRLAAGDRPHD